MPISPSGQSDGFDVGSCVVSTEQYGVPQARHRVIVVGIRDDLMQSAPSSLPIDESSPVSVRGVLQGLPRLRSGLSRTQDSDGAAWLAFVQSATSQRWFRTLQRDQPSVAEAVAGAASRVSVPRRGRGKAFLGGTLHRPGMQTGSWIVDWKVSAITKAGPTWPATCTGICSQQVSRGVPGALPPSKTSRRNSFLTIRTSRRQLPEEGSSAIGFASSCGTVRQRQ